MIEIFSGVTKIVIRGMDSSGDSLVVELEIDRWRSWLSTMMYVEMASARCIGGQCKASMT